MGVVNDGGRGQCCITIIVVGGFFTGSIINFASFFKGDKKVILNEGMPQYRSPYDKGRLVIEFFVSYT